MTVRLGRWAFLAALALAAIPARAGESAVVELFTSQGCSSCPPADHILTRLSREKAVIALTMPVDYWDYLGWKDTLARPIFTARQRAYAEARGDHAVYTPQAVVNGASHVLGSDNAALSRDIGAARLPVAVVIEESADTARVRISGAAPAEGSIQVLLLSVQNSRTVVIQRGENKGKSVSYANVVRDIRKLGEWPGGEAMFEVPASELRIGETDGFVVLVQQVRPTGRILGAGRSRALMPAQ